MSKSRQGLVPNCKLAFECPEDWDAMQPTADVGIRFCNQCDRTVHFCDSDELLRIAVRNGWCVAIPIRSEDSREFVPVPGLPAPLSG